MRPPLKAIIKRSMQNIAARFGKHTWPGDRSRLLILMYHRVLPSNDERALCEEPGMMVTPESLRMQLLTVLKHFEVVQLSDWIQRKTDGTNLPKRACAVTFDDGWADNYEFAYPILRQFNIPATIYLTSSLIGTRKMLWPERLSRIAFEISRHLHWDNPSLKWIKQAKTDYIFSDIPPNQEELAELINHAKLLPDEEIHHRIDYIEKELSLTLTNTKPSMLSWNQVNEMLQSGLIEFGSHTCQHIRINSTTPEEQVRHEIIKSKQQIQLNTGHKVDSFCFPNGDFTPLSLELIREQYTSALTTISGWNSTETDQHLLRRIAIHEGNAHDNIAFMSRLSGWM